MTREIEQDSDYAYERLPSEDHKIEIKEELPFGSLAENTFVQRILFQSPDSKIVIPATNARMIQFKSWMLFHILSKNGLYHQLMQPSEQKKIRNYGAEEFFGVSETVTEGIIPIVINFLDQDSALQLALVSRSFFRQVNHHLIPRDQFDQLKEGAIGLLWSNENKVITRTRARIKSVKKGLYATSVILGLSGAGLFITAMVHAVSNDPNKEAQANKELIASLSTAIPAILLACGTHTGGCWETYLTGVKDKYEGIRRAFKTQRDGWTSFLFPQSATRQTDTTTATTTAPRY